MKLQLVHTDDEKHYPFVEKVLTDSFPPNEYRELEKFRDCTDHNILFHNNIILEKDCLVGFLTYWDFSDFCYAEHFAIEQSLRGKGYGAFSIYLLKSVISKPIVLEVEVPVNEESRRRIKFYQRQGFKLWNNYYVQPPYRQEERPLPMLLMVYGNLSSERHFAYVRDTIYHHVYGLEKGTVL
jgi:GNAT superfamily N-acetyltransferase